MTDQFAPTYTEQVNTLIGVIPALDAGRQDALKAFSKVGFPGKKDENWRYADLAPIRKNAYPPASHSKHTAPDLDGDFAGKLVYVNGGLDEEQSFSGSAMSDVRVSHLSNLIAGNEDRAKDLLHDGDGILLLNTALMREGFVLHIPAGVTVEKPILIHHVVGGADGAALHLRHSIELGEGATATIIECFSGDASAYWLNNVLQIRVSEGADLTHLRLLRDGDNAIHTGKCYVDLDADSRYTSFTVTTGGSMARSESHVRMLGEQSYAKLDCIALAAPKQIHDIVTHIDHAVPNAVSEQMFRAVLAKHSKTAFQGKVTVRADAQHTLADQTCNNILLERTAEANAKPELEIWADDVKCSHGATVGELDDKALFYLTARGIAPDDARALLVEAFLAQVSARLDSKLLKSLVDASLHQWLEKYLRGNA